MFHRIGKMQKKKDLIKQNTVRIIVQIYNSILHYIKIMINKILQLIEHYCISLTWLDLKQEKKNLNKFIVL